jgi:hypothetical protein
MGARNFTGLGFAERAAAETAALRRLQNDLGNTPWTMPQDAPGQRFEARPQLLFLSKRALLGVS